MRSLTLLIACLTAALPSIAQTTASAPATKQSYAEFLQQLVRRDVLVDCAEQMDRVIDRGEQLAESAEPGTGWVGIVTKAGIEIQFRISDLNEAIVYYAVISRGGQELKYSDAVKLASFFADRAGLTHPVDLTEGDKPVFYAQWLIKPKEWKAVRKMMLKVRADNRAEKDVFKALALAVDREMAAREAVRRAR